MILTEGRGFTTPYAAAPPAELLAGAFAYERLFIDIADYIDTEDGMPAGVGSTLIFTFTVPVPEEHRDAMDTDGVFEEPVVLQTYRVDIDQARLIVQHLTEAIEMLDNPIAARERQLEALLERHDATDEHVIPDRRPSDDT